MKKNNEINKKDLVLGETLINKYRPALRSTLNDLINESKVSQRLKMCVLITLIMETIYVLNSFDDHVLMAVESSIQNHKKNLSENKELFTYGLKNKKDEKGNKGKVGKSVKKR